MVRKYNIKAANFVAWVVSSIKTLDEKMIRTTLENDEYLRVSKLKKWAETAPLEEILHIMAKLGFDVFFGGSQVHANGKRGYNKEDAVKFDYAKSGSIEPLLNYANGTGHYIATSRDFIKRQVLFSQVLNGGLHVPNKNFKVLVSLLSRKATNPEEFNNVRDGSYSMKGLIILFTNFFLFKCNPIEGAIAFYMAANDDAPMPASKIYELFGVEVGYARIMHALGALRKKKFIVSYGSHSRRSTQYVLSHQGWNFIGKALDSFMKDINFRGILEEQLNEKYKPKQKEIKYELQAEPM